MHDRPSGQVSCRQAYQEGLFVSDLDHVVDDVKIDGARNGVLANTFTLQAGHITLRPLQQTGDPPNLSSMSDKPGRVLDTASTGSPERRRQTATHVLSDWHRWVLGTHAVHAPAPLAVSLTW